MARAQRVDISGNIDLLEYLWIASGLATALKAIEGLDPALQKLPGAGLTKLAIEKELAEARQHVATRSLKAAAKAGHDISTSNGVRCDIDGRRPFLVVEFEDGEGA